MSKCKRHCAVFFVIDNFFYKFIKNAFIVCLICGIIGTARIRLRSGTIVMCSDARYLFLKAEQWENKMKKENRTTRTTEKADIAETSAATEKERASLRANPRSALVKKRITSKKIAYYGLCLAMFFTAFFLDALISSIGTPVSFAVLTLPIATTIILLSQDYLDALIIGFLLGFASFIRQFIYPTGSSPFFIYPHVSILPRILVGIGTYSFFRFIERFTRGGKSADTNSKQKMRDIVSLSAAVGICGVIAATINTFSVMSMMATVRSDKTLLGLLQAVLLVNYLPEAIAAAIISPLVVRQVAVNRKLKIGGVIPVKALKQ